MQLGQECGLFYVVRIYLRESRESEEAMKLSSLGLKSWSKWILLQLADMLTSTAELQMQPSHAIKKVTAGKNCSQSLCSHTGENPDILQTV
jgi:hypothetical protein